MISFLDPERLVALADRLAAAAGLPEPERNYFARMIVRHLQHNPACARRVIRLHYPARAWAIEAHKKGQLYRFCDPGPEIRNEIITTGHEAASFFLRCDSPVGGARRVEKFRRDFLRLNFSAVQSRLEQIRAEKTRLEWESEFRKIRRGHITIPAAGGRRWELVRSRAELSSAGGHLHNCLHRSSPFHQEFWTAFDDGQADFWKLVKADHTIVGVAEIRDGAIVQAKGPHNDPLDKYVADLVILIAGLGLSIDGCADLTEIGMGTRPEGPPVFGKRQPPPVPLRRPRGL